MILWRTLLVAMLAGMPIYPGVVAADHGLNLLTPFFGAIAAMGWQGRFNLDFLTMPVLTGIWVAWRGGFTRGAIMLGVAASLLGILFLASHLAALSLGARGDVRRMLPGVHADR